MSSSQSHTVLVVEDEGIVRLDAAESLRDAGFEVLEAADATEALTAFEEHDEIGVLFTDIDIPGGIDGLELARRVHRRRPKVRLLLTSGAVKIEPADIPDSGAFVRKPYSAEAVARTIRRMLG
jgi:CheY-like chemotaxis protein